MTTNLKSKKVVVPALALAILISAGAYGISRANGNDDNRNNLIAKISSRFGLSQSDIEKVFEENRSEMQAKRLAEAENKLNEYVAKGEITEAQKNLILAKRKEMQAERQSQGNDLRNMTREERQAEMEKRHDEMEAWCEANGIDEKYVIGSGRMGGKGLGLHQNN